MTKRKSVYSDKSRKVAPLRPHKQPELKKRASSKILSTTAVALSMLLLVFTIVIFHTQISSLFGRSAVKHAPSQKSIPPTAVNPQTTLTAIGKVMACSEGVWLNIVAHEDDDILFMNPDIQQAIKSGVCVRTVYVTAGDDGQSSPYWRAREHGPMAAYAAMAGIPDNWTSQIALVMGHSVSVSTLRDNPKISLIFLRLPDGGISGLGFSANQYGSLLKLRLGTITTLRSVDGSSTYSAHQLINTLKNIMKLDQPSVINTQAFSPALARGDHSDHQIVGYFTSIARLGLNSDLPLHRYIGYESGHMPVNLTADQTAAKHLIFDSYEQYDKMICNKGCYNGFTYLSYMGREYQQTDTAP